MPSITGYPSGIRGKQLSLESSLLAVAGIYGALSEKRPYREALPPSQITGIMDSEVPAKLDGECYEAPRFVIADSTLPAPRQEELSCGRWIDPDFEVTEVFI